MPSAKKKILIPALIAAAAAALFLCLRPSGRHPARDPYEPSEEALICLYGEYHGEKDFLEVEFQTWKARYDEGMRDLFIEAEYYYGQMLNLWMHQEDDRILDILWKDTEGTLAHTEAQFDFYRKIKQECPQTVFHGTDVGHSRQLGEWYLAYLSSQGKQGSEEYRITEENIAQGDRYYADGGDERYREDCMVRNFIREYDRLCGAVIMGIYGDAHADPSDASIQDGTHCMAYLLKEHYGDHIRYESVQAMVNSRQ